MKGWDIFFDNITFKVGDGSRVKFWGKKLCGGLVLKDEFSMLYSISC